MTGKPRGLANLTPERRREIASQGGSAVAKGNRTFSRDPELARQAGQRGGKIRRRPEPTPIEPSPAADPETPAA